MNVFSMFIELPGRTKDEAFTIGQEIADAVTADNPKPVKLKFEKVTYGISDYNLSVTNSAIVNYAL